jgi:hypothetical protein
MEKPRESGFKIEVSRTHSPFLLFPSSPQSQTRIPLFLDYRPVPSGNAVSASLHLSQKAVAEESVLQEGESSTDSVMPSNIPSTSTGCLGSSKKETSRKNVSKASEYPSGYLFCQRYYTQ